MKRIWCWIFGHNYSVTLSRGRRVNAFYKECVWCGEKCVRCGS